MVIWHAANLDAVIGELVRRQVANPLVVLVRLRGLYATATREAAHASRSRAPWAVRWRARAAAWLSARARTPSAQRRDAPDAIRDAYGARRVAALTSTCGTGFFSGGLSESAGLSAGRASVVSRAFQKFKFVAEPLWYVNDFSSSSSGSLVLARGAAVFFGSAEIFVGKQVVKKKDREKSVKVRTI